MADRVAVVVVHGVGDPGAGHPSSAIASMLLALQDKKSHTLYQPFYSSPVRIAVHKCGADLSDEQQRTKSNPASGRGRKFDERGMYVVAAQKGLPHSSSPPDVGYSEDQLADYVPTDIDQTYETVRLSSVRRENPQKTVHIFEMYWADLVTVGKGLRLLADIYQIVLHLASVGQHAIDMARAANPASRSWRWFDRIHDFAVRWLCLPLPIFNIMMVAAAFMGLSAFLPDVAVPYVAWGVTWLLLSIALAFAAFAGDVWKKGPWKRAFLWILLILITAAISYPLLSHPSAAHRILAGEMLVIALLALFPILRAYAALRPGTNGVSKLICALTAAAAGFELFHVDSSQTLLAAVHVLDDLWLALFVSWLFLFVCSIASIIAGWVVVFAHWALPDRTCARRVVWTARLTLALPTTLFFLLTLALWTGLLCATSKMLSKSASYEPAAVFRWLENHDLAAFVDWSNNGNISDHLQSLWKAGAGVALGPIAALMLVASVLSIWAMLPSVLSELFVPKDENARRIKYANWLDGGFALSRIAGGIVVLASLLILPLAMPEICWPHWAPLRSLYHWLNEHAGAIYISVGGLVAGAGGLRLLPGRVGQVVSDLAVPLRAALDVDAYLRQYPLKGNPKARIFARYASLLRYLSKWIDPATGKQYDRIVIVSHSQGTVITADLLRFLHYHHDPSLVRLFDSNLIYLFTMGSPLRQLYGRRLPHLYEWTEHDLQHSFGQRLPDPAKLRVAHWSNAYRSADYIGRNLWLTDHEDATWCPGRGKDRNRNEFCCGPGAHVHYWDASDELIAREIDRLIDC